ncbi:MAG: pilus assembly protein [Lachnospiraceae bacterium]|nr:pilus assembly protein [Lachnospiraceae bacterium]
MGKCKVEEKDVIEKRSSIYGRNCSGSATVEAACLMPMVLGVIFLTIYLSVYNYNRAAAVSLAGRCIVMAAGMEQEGAGIIEDKVMCYLDDGLQAMPMVTASGEVSAGLMTVKVTTGFDQTMGVHLFSSLPGGMQFKTTKTMTRLDPATYLWTVKIAKDAMGNGAGSRVSETEEGE